MAANTSHSILNRDRRATLKISGSYVTLVERREAMSFLDQKVAIYQRGASETRQHHWTGSVFDFWACNADRFVFQDIMTMKQNLETGGVHVLGEGRMQIEIRFAT